ncbi:hypothetical protein N0V93_002288 [Gnomoniopsis smithogilvyi]|uniref:SMP-30/Gluconolactonase/LRE-like region domain-containing protein n=1 Tax=Gnomoniopsis smithogilvyi TaxID=1191159 RepID=A0A9W8YW80_9PEZI|nr:hypothetical protein N0V93_002288 [Gnomoniopsis smithogilvyi]
MSLLSFHLRALALFTLLPTILAQACRNNATLPLPFQTVFQLAPGNNFTFFENIVSRSNGDLLITMAVPEPNVFLLQNPASACPTFSPVFSVPGVNGTDGIAEVANRPDVFAVIAGNLSLSGNPANGVPGTWSVWEIDLSGGTNTSVSGLVNCASGATVRPTISARKIADFPMAPRLNGVAAIPGTSAVLVGDSELGVAFRLDTVTGQITTALDFPQMKPVSGAGSIDDALGLNGLKVGNDGFVYFTNAAARTINRVAILPDGSGPMPGATVQTIAAVPNAGWMDDLDLKADGSLWVTTNVSMGS